MAETVLTLVGVLVMIAVLALGLRWTFGTGARLPDPDGPTGDGLLTEVSRVPTQAAAQVLRARLADAGVRSTIGRADGAYRLLVFPADLATARLVLSPNA